MVSLLLRLVTSDLSKSRYLSLGAGAILFHYFAVLILGDTTRTLAVRTVGDTTPFTVRTVGDTTHSFS